MLTLSLWSSSSLRWRAGSYEPFHAPFLFYTRFLPSHSSLYPSFIVVPTFHRQSHSPPSHPLSTGTPTLHYRTHTPPLHPLSTITPTFYHRTHALLSHPRPTVSPTLHHLTHAPPLSPRSAVAPTLYCRTQFSISPLGSYLLYSTFTFTLVFILFSQSQQSIALLFCSKHPSKTLGVLFSSRHSFPHQRIISVLHYGTKLGHF